MKQRILEGKTKVVVTIGPSSSSKEMIREFFKLGVDVFRLNFSHGSFEEHLERIKIIRELEKVWNQSFYPPRPSRSQNTLGNI